MTPAVIGVIAARYLPTGGGPGLGLPWNFSGSAYTPPASGVVPDPKWNFNGLTYTPPVTT